MGIEELINEYKQDKLMSRGFTVDDLGTGTRAVYKEIDEVLEDLEQLKSSLPTQPELVEVPKVTGVMIDYFKREGFSLHESLNLHVNVPNTLSLVYKEFREWLTLDDYATKEDIFARAWLDGYTVKKEQLYYVRLKNTTLIDANHCYLWLNQSTNEVFFEKKTLKWTNEGNVKNTFTEQEIAAISDGAFVDNKAFEAVPVGEE